LEFSVVAAVSGCSPVFACVLGFETGLIPVFQQLVLPQKPVNTTIADAEFLQRSPVPAPISPPFLELPSADLCCS